MVTKARIEVISFLLCCLFNEITTQQQQDTLYSNFKQFLFDNVI